MKNKPTHTISDLTFIGAGVSTAYTLIPLLNLLKKKSPQKPLKISIIERDDELFTGLAYGKRSSDTSLLITSLADFLTDDYERNAFIEWLAEHKKELLEDLEKKGGDLTKNWLNTHEEEIQNDKWEDIYIPRRFFGIYIHERVQNAIKSYQENFELFIDHIQDEAVNVSKEGDSYLIDLKNNNSIETTQLVLSIGIPPKREIWSDKLVSKVEGSGCLITDPYDKSLPENFKKIKEFLSEKETKGNVLICGSNASAMEMLYELNDEAAIASKLDKFYVLSPQGSLPNSAQDEFTRSKTFTAHHLNELKNETSLTAKEIYNAALKDLDEADKLGYGAAITEAPISKSFTSLLDKLSADELRNFACHYGNEIGKRQRRAGNHYTQVVDNLREAKRLTNIKGYFENITDSNPDSGMQFSYKAEKSSESQPFPNNVDVVINCTGGKTLEFTEISPLIDGLIQNGLCKVNDSNRGFEVNNSLQSNTGIYINGPLLAGNIVNNLALWHIEHCGRIIRLGDHLAISLSEKIA